MTTGLNPVGEQVTQRTVIYDSSFEGAYDLVGEVGEDLNQFLLNDAIGQIITLSFYIPRISGVGAQLPRINIFQQDSGAGHSTDQGALYDGYIIGACSLTNMTNTWVNIPIALHKWNEATTVARIGIQVDLSPFGTAASGTVLGWMRPYGN